MVEEQKKLYASAYPIRSLFASIYVVLYLNCLHVSVSFVLYLSYWSCVSYVSCLCLPVWRLSRVFVLSVHNIPAYLFSFVVLSFFV
jgi:hypothetical protein